MRSARFVFVFVFCYLFFAFFIIPHLAFAQTSNNTTSNNSFASPNMDPDVPRNQHTYAQAVTIEVMSAIMCQLTGIDPVDSSSPCVDVNPQTKRLGFTNSAKSQDNLSQKEPQIGGLLGTATEMIGSTYRPVATTSTYTQHLADNFGIVKKTYAAGEASYGFQSLKPILNLWIAVRNIAYALLVFACSFIGIGIMLRVKIDPRTVMTIQNQIPKVIVAIILITFSYAISAVMVDLMWVTTYAGVNMIVNSSPETAAIDTGGNPPGNTLSSKANKQLLEIPLVYVNDIFHTGKNGGKDNLGIFHITNGVSNGIGDVIYDVARNILGVDKGDNGCLKIKHRGFIPTSLPNFNPGACIADAFGFLAKIVANLIIFIVFIIALFKIWFNLLKAYIFTLFYIIISPVYIVFGLLPTKPLGFEAWLRRFFANIAIFPITAFIIVGARVLMDIYDKGAATQFIPPLIGHNASANFGSFLALGAILVAPSIQTILREKLGVKNIGTPGIVAAGLAGGAAVVGAPVGRAMKHLNRYDVRTGDIGALAKLKRTAGEKTIKAAAGSHIPFIGNSAEKALVQRKSLETYGLANKKELAATRESIATEDKASGTYKTSFSRGKRRKFERDRKKTRP